MKGFFEPRGQKKNPMRGRKRPQAPFLTFSGLGPPPSRPHPSAPPFAPAPAPAPAPALALALALAAAALAAVGWVNLPGDRKTPFPGV